MSRKRKKIVLWGTVGFVVASLLTVLVVWLLNVSKPTTVADEIRNSAPGQAVMSLTDVNGEPAATVIIAPPTVEWWWTLGLYSPNPVAYTLDFSKYSEGSKYIAYSLSPGADFKSYGMLGLPTSFIIYNDAAAASKIAEILTADGVSHQLIENVIFFVPEGAFSDVNYALNQYKMATENDTLELNGKAKMFMEYNSFKIFMDNAAVNDVDKETFDTLASLMGITANTYWSGESEDGLHWVGQFTGLEKSSLNSPQAIQTYIENRRYIVQPDGTLVSPGEGVSETGVIDSGQSTLFSSGIMDIRSNTEVAAARVDTSSDDGEPTGPKYSVEPLPASEGIYQININKVNDWIGAMLGTENVLSLTTFEKISITIQEDGSSTVDITLLPSIVEDANISGE